MYVHTYIIYTYTYTHTHTYVYICIYIYINMCPYMCPYKSECVLNMCPENMCPDVPHEDRRCRQTLAGLATDTRTLTRQLHS